MDKTWSIPMFGPRDKNNPGIHHLQSSSTEQNFKATIVAVHGLKGHYAETWTNRSVDPPFSWIKDGLGKDLPECRLLSFGWDFSSGKSLRDHASDLHLLLLEHLEIKGNDQPILFIAHGFGGLLVKEVLIQSANLASSVVHECTAAVLFFGTPHRISHASKISLDLAPNIANTLEKNTISLDDDLRKDSVSLQSTNEAFMHTQPSYEIYSFYETLAPKLEQDGALNLTRVEATLNMKDERVIALPLSHKDLVSFTDRHSMVYPLVLSRLKNIVSRLPRVRPPVAQRPPVPKIPPISETQLTTPKRIDFKGYIHLFKQVALSKAEECLLSDMLVKPPTMLLNNIKNASKKGALEPLIWVHVPLNNTAWVNPCLQNIVSNQQRNQELQIMDQRYWSSNERKRQTLPHSRYFEPSSFVSRDKQTTQFVIYLPYLHWDSTDCFVQRAKYADDTLGGKSADIPDGLSEDGKAIFKIMRDDSSNSFSLHPRRSLDQFYYSSLQNTSSRDQDQVLSKYTPENTRGGKKMIMVDQLWLWLLESHELIPGSPGRIKTTIFTSFPRKQREAGSVESDLDDIADLRQAIIDEANGIDVERATNRCYYVGLIIEQAVNVMLRVRTEVSLDLMEVFRAAIGEAAEKQINFLRELQKKLKRGPNVAHDSSDLTDYQTKREEVELALELTDIIDELNTINRLFEAQKDAIDAAIKIFDNLGQAVPKQDRYKPLKDKLSTVITQDIEGYVKQVKRMTADAQRTKKNLMDLLDLQQKEETLQEAQYSNAQADAAKKQARASEIQSQILFLFTFVTIVFAPLSFFTSYYGMNVREFTGDASNTNQRAVWMTMGPISVAIILGLLTAAWYMYKQAKKNLDSDNKKGKGNKEMTAA